VSSGPQTVWRSFYVDVLGGEVLFDGEPTVVALAKGAKFLTPPLNRGPEIRCYMPDPDGHLIEVGETKPDILEEQRSSDSADE
jgi:hypothetical protein